ncbi:MAG: hypothetical protein KJ578_15785 [Bacteroidetes bacterium]|nr:hypothetical protein [Bacteroidota bacterium]
MAGYHEADADRRVDLEPAALEALLGDDPLTQGIIGTKMAPFRESAGNAGAIYTIDFATLGVKGVSALRGIGGRPASIPYNETPVAYTCQPYALETFLDLSVLRKAKDPTKRENGALWRIARDWKLLHEARVIAALNAGLATMGPSGANWDQAAGTFIRADILTGVRTIATNTQGLFRANVFAGGLQLFQVLELAPEMTNLIGGLLKLSELNGGQIVGWLQEQGFEYALIGSSPNWLTLNDVYLLHVSPEGMAAEEAVDTISTVYNGEEPLEVWNYTEYGKRINYAVEAWTDEQVVYPATGIIIQNVF